MCDDLDYIIELGLTNHLCDSIDENEFFAAYVGGVPDGDACGTGHNEGNGIFGCGSSLTSWVEQTNICGPLDLLDSNGLYGDATNYGWILDNNALTQELWNTRHLLQNGVMYGGMKTFIFALFVDINFMEYE